MKFFKSSMIVTLGILISKALSLIFIFPFSRIVGAVGIALYNYAYAPFLLILELSTFGIPEALSKLVGNKNSINEHVTAYRIFKKGLFLMIIFGIISFLLLNFIAPFYASYALSNNSINKNELINSIRILSISLLIIPFTSGLKGFLQGNLEFLACSISQIVEQIIRVSLILITTSLIINNGGSYINAIYWTLFSTIIAEFFSLLILYIFYKKKNIITSGYVFNISFKEILTNSFPFFIYGISISLFSFIDSLFFSKGLTNYGISNPEYIYGIYSFEVLKLINIPLTIIIGIKTVLLPVISNGTNTINKINKALQIVFMIFIPIMFITMLYSNEIYNLLYVHNEGGKILFVSSMLIPIMALNSLLISIITGTNLDKFLYFPLLLGILFKFITTYIFISYLSYSGAVLSSFISYSLIILANIYILHKNKLLRYKFILKQFNRFSLISIIGIIGLIIVKFILSGINEYLLLMISLILYLFYYLYVTKKYHISIF